MICKPCTEGDHCGKPGQAGPHCPCQHRPRGTGQPEVQVALGTVPVSLDPEAVTHDSDGRSADPDLYVSPGFNETVKDVSTLALLADWMKAVRTGQRARAAVLHGALAARLKRLS